MVVVVVIVVVVFVLNIGFNIGVQYRVHNWVQYSVYILLFSTYIDGFSHRTTFVCSFCYDDFNYKSCSAIRNHIREAHPSEMATKLKTYSIPLPRYEVMSF